MAVERRARPEHTPYAASRSSLDGNIVVLHSIQKSTLARLNTVETKSE